MSDKDLRELLAELHGRLERTGSLDADSRALLATVAHDIERALAADAAAGEHEPRLEELAVRFEAEHPALAGMLRQISDALGKAGI